MRTISILRFGGLLLVGLVLLSFAACARAAPAESALQEFAELNTVSFSAPDGSRLQGTLSVPKGCARSCPLVLVIPGAGRIDRDGDFLGNHVYLDIASGLAKNGFAVFRYDKRGTAQSVSAKPQSAVTRNDLISDALSALDAASRDPRIAKSRVFVLGHSEGGEIALAVAQHVRVKGLILVAPMPMPYIDLLNRQLARNPEKIQLVSLFEATPLVRSFSGVDPLAELKAVEKLMPVLVLHGSADPTITDDDIRAFRLGGEAGKQFTFIELAGDDHMLFRLGPGETSKDAAELTHPHAVDSRAISALSDWLREQINNPE